jgi:hypothetical protein
MAKRKPVEVIDVPVPGGVRGRIERLYREFFTKAQALRLTAEILDDDDRRNALDAAPKKFLDAVNHRNGAVGRPVLTKEPKSRRGVQKVKSPIFGPRMSLFLLEHLDDEQPKPIADLQAALANAGSPIPSVQNLNGPLGAALVRRGYVKKSRDGYRRTAKGAARAIDLRKRLEATGKVAPGGYLIKGFAASQQTN